MPPPRVPYIYMRYTQHLGLSFGLLPFNNRLTPIIRARLQGIPIILPPNHQVSATCQSSTLSSLSTYKSGQTSIYLTTIPYITNFVNTFYTFIYLFYPIFHLLINYTTRLINYTTRHIMARYLSYIGR